MKLTLESLKEHGAFTGRPVEKEITGSRRERTDGNGVCTAFGLLHSPQIFLLLVVKSMVLQAV